LNPPKTDLPQPLVEHLDEFRRRALVCLWWFLIFSAIGYSQVDRVVDWLAKPVGDFIFSSPGEAFFIRFRIAFGLGGACTVPIVIYQVWRFVEISLGARERRWVRAIIPASCILFFVGVALALFVVAPVAVHFLLQFTTPHLKPLISISDYLSFLFWMLIGFGILFQLPVVVVLLSRLGIVDPRTLGKYRRHAFIGILIVSAVLTPGPDMFSQLVLALPTYLLFEVSLLVARSLKPTDASTADQ
jgi:sec-independent protein translocase protein TatC